METQRTDEKTHTKGESSRVNKSGLDDSHTYERLLAAAFKSYTATGYQKTNLREIAKSLNITATAVYYHFHSKEDLLSTAYDEYVNRLLELHDRLTTSMTPPEQLWAFAAAHLRIQFPIEDPTRGSKQIFLLQHMLPFVKPKAAKRLRQTARRGLTKLRSIIEQGVEDGSFACDNPTIAAFSIISISHSAPAWFNTTGDVTMEELMAICGDQALRLMQAETPETRDQLLDQVVASVDQHYRALCWS